VRTLQQGAEKEMLDESHRHRISRVLGTCPGLGPIRVPSFCRSRSCRTGSPTSGPSGSMPVWPRTRPARTPKSRRQGHRRHDLALNMPPPPTQPLVARTERGVPADSPASIKDGTWRTRRLARQYQGRNVAYPPTRSPVSRTERGVPVDSLARIKGGTWRTRRLTCRCRGLTIASSSAFSPFGAQRTHPLPHCRAERGSTAPDVASGFTLGGIRSHRLLRWRPLYQAIDHLDALYL
jgi:hypothetical protein